MTIFVFSSVLRTDLHALFECLLLKTPVSECLKLLWLPFGPLSENLGYFLLQPLVTLVGVHKLPNLGYQIFHQKSCRGLRHHKRTSLSNLILWPLAEHLWNWRGGNGAEPPWGRGEGSRLAGHEAGAVRSLCCRRLCSEALAERADPVGLCKEEHVSGEGSVTRWLYYLFNVWPFRKMRICKII